MGSFDAQTSVEFYMLKAIAAESAAADDERQQTATPVGCSLRPRQGRTLSVN